jgi:branched-chain amino acid transport system substrate-binding protein
LKTVVVINPESEGGHLWMDSSLEAAPRHGLTVVRSEFYDQTAQDFYPLITKILPSNPDAVEFGGFQAGQLCLMTKQLRELGYEGFILQPALAPIELLREVAGEENLWGIATDQADYTNPVFPQSLRDLYQRWLEKYASPGETTMNVCVPHGYGHLEFLVTAMQEADSIDVDEVIKAFEDTDFSFERYLNSPAKVSGLATNGILRQFPHYIIYAEIWDGEVEIIDGADVITP